MTPDIKATLMHEKVTLDGHSPIKVKWNQIPHFVFPWHFHSEYEIIYIINGYGHRFVGESMETYGEGDLVLLGSQLPHFWKSDEVYHQNNPMLKMNYIVVQFSHDFLADSIQHYPELSSLKQLLSKAQQGIHFPQPHGNIIGRKIKELYHLNGFDRFNAFLGILHQMGQCQSMRLLSPHNHNILPQNDFGDRLNRLLHRLNRSYQQKITLEETAQWFGMNTTAFSRYFKQKTSKTFVNYINEMRIAHACKLLQNGSVSVTQACFECGFNNISNFNRCFKQVMNTTPTGYIEQFTTARLRQAGEIKTDAD